MKFLNSAARMHSILLGHLGANVCTLHLGPGWWQAGLCFEYTAC